MADPVPNVPQAEEEEDGEEDHGDSSDTIDSSDHTLDTGLAMLRQRRILRLENEEHLREREENRRAEIRYRRELLLHPRPTRRLLPAGSSPPGPNMFEESKGSGGIAPRTQLSARERVIEQAYEASNEEQLARIVWTNPWDVSPPYSPLWREDLGNEADDEDSEETFASSHSENPTQDVGYFGEDDCDYSVVSDLAYEPDDEDDQFDLSLDD